MIEETPVSEAPPAPQRNLVGWVVLAVLFSLMTFASLNAALKRSPSPTDDGERYDLILKMSTSLREQADRVAGEPGGKEVAKMLRNQASEMLDEPVANAVEELKQRPGAARAYAVLRTEQGREVPPAKLEALSRDPSEQNKAYAQIYGPNTLTAKEADDLASRLKGDSFTDQLAQVHAHEKAGQKGHRSKMVDVGFAARAGLAGGIGFFVLMSSCMVWLLYLSGRKNPLMAPKGHPVGAITFPDADRLAIRAAQTFGTFVALSAAVGLIPGLRELEFASILASVGTIAIVATLSLLPIMGKRVTFKDVGLTKEGLGRNIVWGFAGFLAEIPGAMILMLLGLSLFNGLPQPSHPIEETLSTASVWQALLAMVMASVLAPLFEEFLFRGLLFPAFSKIAGSVLAGAVISSLLFGIIHPQGPALVLSLAWVGGVSCYLAHQTRSLVPSVVMHACHNGLILGIALLLR